MKIDVIKLPKLPEVPEAVLKTNPVYRFFEIIGLLGVCYFLLEDLNVKGMVKNHKLAKHISDASWGTFVRLLEYKANWNDKQIVKINRWYPSSKTCCECGWINQDLNLSIREWTCKNGHVLDRDLNASKNILKEGLKIISSGTGDYTGGDSNKTSAKKHKSVKPEAHPIAFGVGG